MDKAKSSRAIFMGTKLKAFSQKLLKNIKPITAKNES